MRSPGAHPGSRKHRLAGAIEEVHGVEPELAANLRIEDREPEASGRN